MTDDKCDNSFVDSNEHIFMMKIIHRMYLLFKKQENLDAHGVTNWEIECPEMNQ